MYRKQLACLEDFPTDFVPARSILSGNVVVKCV